MGGSHTANGAIKPAAAGPVDTSARLKSLRAVLKENSVNAYIVPTEDPHQSEYIAPCDKRRAWISGFTGSAGTAVVTDSTAALWTDGRYFLQGSQQLDKNWTLMKSGMPDVPTKEEWLVKTLPAGSRISFDPKLISSAGVKSLRDAIRDAEADLEIAPIADNLVDAVWTDKPGRPNEKVIVLEDKYTGRTSEDKIKELREKMADKKAHALVVTALDEVAWLFNLRGSDIPFNPVFFSFALVTADEAVLYLDHAKLTDDCAAHLAHVTVRPYDAVYADLAAMGAKLAAQGKAQANGNGNGTAGKAKQPKVWMDGRCNYALVTALGSEKLADDARSPITLAKSLKNEAELEGFRQCHVRDAAAVVNFLAWLEHELVVVGNTTLTEWSAAEVLESHRARQADFMGLSFDTISSTGPNAAIVHYSPDKYDCAVIKKEQIYLLDSGGQYKDGTTDITRTLHFGEPTAEEKDAFTRVLKGHIALDMTVFPKGTTGYILDAIARRSLWQAGLDYRHGTGHGVGSYLNVHEGPHGIGTRITLNDVGMQAGMTVTDEPGYYADGKFGIRIENLLLVRDAKTAYNFGDRGYLGFEHVTLVPIQSKLIDVTMLSPEEREWMNKYHEECWGKVSPLLEKGSLGYEWLKRATAAL